ncbi:ArsR/SmtB family transcription factor [Roseibium album]|uniref:Putative HTH-type transcriptional regulator YgaV n=1 Tax=Roseibium album TaxID=311410 RepID=A0A0M6ZBW8_9HYPH|nr:metalloregulator ArsR/SmtB family transcription factor [Roseibium album]CTQ59927.1 putative HTH-type transcriptional regulator YgaV [Roseibium album]CTQ76777.1 putative HTH-type transcriptional regulator YgaV [Roseibium album]CTQ77177.1 putative HTH-type transcriptional regulator YgaV [Roseibium album]
MNETDALAAFASISSATRLRILKLLVEAGTNGLSAGEIAAAVGATPSRTSFHLSNMSEAGLVTSSRMARQITYRLDFAVVGALMRYILEDCCKNNPTVRACCVTDGGC